MVFKVLYFSTMYMILVAVKAQASECLKNYITTFHLLKCLLLAMVDIFIN